MAKKYRLYVTVANDAQERHEEFFVTDLSSKEMNDLGCYGLEQLARQHAALLGHEYVTFAT